MKKLFLIIGAPGSGKTTDAELIADKHKNITHYSTGDMFRAEVASGSERGKVIESFISKGLIVPIEIAIETILSAIKNMNEITIQIANINFCIECKDEFEIVDALSALSGVAVPQAVEEIRHAAVRHNRECGVDDMKGEVKDILGIS